MRLGDLVLFPFGFCFGFLRSPGAFSVQLFCDPCAVKKPKVRFGLISLPAQAQRQLTTTQQKTARAHKGDASKSLRCRRCRVVKLKSVLAVNAQVIAQVLMQKKL